MKKNSGKTLVSGLLLGALVGTAYSMLFAQKKGSKLRKELKEKSTSPRAVVDAVVQEYGKAGRETGKVVKEFLASEGAKGAVAEFKAAFGPLVTRWEKQGKTLSDAIGSLLERNAKDSTAKRKSVSPRATRIRKE